jgi:glycosyltransferase involved in cell wall biosynthesis
VREFDVVHIHALFSFPSIAAAWIAYWRHVPYIVRPLGTLAAYGMNKRRPWIKKLSLALIEAPILRRAAAVQFTSVAERDEARALKIPFHGVIIPLGIPAPARGPATDLLDPEIGRSGQRIILFLSRIDPKKNVEGLLRAFAKLDGAPAPIRLVIAGYGTAPYAASLKELAHSLGIGHDVDWLGQVEGDRKAALLELADVFVLPSFSENFGIAAAEALLAGKPCILGRGVALAAEVEAAGAGRAVDPDPESIAIALRVMLSDEAMRLEMGRKGRLLAQHEYSTEKMADRLIELYRNISGARAVAA